MPLTLPAPRKKQGKKRNIPLSLTADQFDRLTVANQVKRAFLPGARVAAFTGLLIGGFVPMATYTLVHCECVKHPYLWVLVAGGLLYSAMSVFKWATDAFSNRTKALGFCVLLEGILTFSHIAALGFAALGILVFINAVSAACALQVRKA